MCVETGVLVQIVVDCRDDLLAVEHAHDLLGQQHLEVSGHGLLVFVQGGAQGRIPEPVQPRVDAFNELYLIIGVPGSYWL